MNKPILLLLPGLDGTALMFRWLIEKLSDKLDVRPIAYPDDSLMYEDALHQVERCLPHEDFFVLGECYSGPVAIQLAHRHADRIKGILLAASFATSPSSMLRLAHRALVIPIPDAVLRLCAKPLVKGFEDTVKLTMDTALRQVSTRTLMRRLQQVASVDVTRQLQQLSQPILYLQGQRDHLVLPRSARLVQQCAAQTRIVKLNAPHLLLQYAAQEAATAILHFINQHAHHHA